MSVERLEELLRHAGRVEHLAAVRPAVTRGVNARVRLRWWAGVAAALAIAAVWPQRAPRPPTDLAGGSAVVQREPSGLRPVREGQDGIPAAAVLALFRTWDEECDCPAWTAYAWQQDAGGLVHSPEVEWPAAADRPVPIDPTIVLAIARDAGDLPRTDEQRHALLRCLNAGSPLVDQDATCAPSVVQSCLPETVTVVARPVQIR